MKIRYLPPDDRQNLRILRHTTDKDVIVAVLESFFKRRHYTLQALWEYRKWFLDLTKEQLDSHPLLRCGLTVIFIMQGEYKKASQTLDSFSEDDPYRIAISPLMPGQTKDEILSSLFRLKNAEFKFNSFPLTGARPSVFNGIWDLTPYIDEIIGNKEKILDVLDSIYPQVKENIYEMYLAESLYQRNECYDALVKVIALIPLLQEAQDLRILFAALTLQVYILVLNGQAQAALPLMENMKSQVIRDGAEEFIPNLDAMEAWASMYDGNMTKVTEWMRDGAPDEYNRFCMLDSFRYLVKIRAYIITGKYMSVTMLGSKLSPLFEADNRYMDTCELYLLWAMSDYADGREKEALERFERSIALSEKYRYDRLIADEGTRAYELIKLYQKHHGKTEYSERLRELTLKVTTLHPLYLRCQLPEKPALTETEMKVLRLLAACYTNAEIAEFTETAIDTVKQHCKHICAKLGVKNRHQAASKAVELGLIDPARSLILP